MSVDSLKIFQVRPSCGGICKEALEGDILLIRNLDHKDYSAVHKQLHSKTFQMYGMATHRKKSDSNYFKNAKALNNQATLKNNFQCIAIGLNSRRFKNIVEKSIEVDYRFGFASVEAQVAQWNMRIIYFVIRYFSDESERAFRFKKLIDEIKTVNKTALPILLMITECDDSEVKQLEDLGFIHTLSTITLPQPQDVHNLHSFHKGELFTSIAIQEGKLSSSEEVNIFGYSLQIRYDEGSIQLKPPVPITRSQNGRPTSHYEVRKMSMWKTLALFLLKHNRAVYLICVISGVLIGIITGLKRRKHFQRPLS